ncbi:MAG: MMPL family transporter, partial [Persicimonas sp.]
IIMAGLAALGATLTLPGIAGIILTVGMAVDANVIIYERIREEIHRGRSPYDSVAKGFKMGMTAVIDANITTAIAAVVLMQYGTGPIRGFAVTLLIGIAGTLFTGVFFSRLLFDTFGASRSQDTTKVSI